MTQTIIYHLSFIQLQMDLGLTSGYKYNLVADKFVRSREIVYCLQAIKE